MSNDLKRLVQRIAAKTDLTQEQIGKRVNLSRTRFNVRINAATPDDDLYHLLSEEFKHELIDDYAIIDNASPEDVIALSASVKMLYEEVSELKAKNEKIKYDEAIALMKKRANSILNELISD